MAQSIKITYLIVIFTSISSLLIAQNNIINLQNQSFQTFESYKDIGYDQSLRPQFHLIKNLLREI